MTGLQGTGPAPLAILTAPDPRLRAAALPAERFDDGLRALAEAMLDLMYAAPGRGLAAPQVGVPLRLFVMDPTWKEGRPDPRALVNPELLWASEEQEEAEEGCLSIPGLPCRVRRPVAVRLRWRGLDGERHEAAFDGFAARCAQHEMDHLDGILCTDRSESPA